MASINDLLKSDTTKGLAIGIGATVLAPIVVPAVSAVARPLAKGAIKAGIIVYEKGRETMTEMGEIVEDLVAEAKAELEQGGSEITEETASEAKTPPSSE